MTEGFPNFLIPGAGKSGTTVLCHFLRQHPEVFICDPKEPCFFSFAGSRPHYMNEENFIGSLVTDLPKYQALFANTNGYNAIGDASTYYLLLERQSIENIRRYVPEHQKLKIIIMLRNPVDRAFSNYMMFHMNGIEELSFEKAISDAVVNRRKQDGYGPSFDYLDEGLYYRRVKAYMDEFPNTRIYLYDDLQRDPRQLMANIYSFLEVDNTFTPDLDVRINTSGRPRIKSLQKFMGADNRTRRFARKYLLWWVSSNLMLKVKQRIIGLNQKHVRMSDDVKKQLKEFYREDVSKLGDLIQRDLRHWT